jgi:hypothetical protein
MPKTISNIGTEGKTHGAGIGAILLAAFAIYQTTPRDQLSIEDFFALAPMAIPYVIGIWAARRRSTVQMTNDQLILIFQMCEERGINYQGLMELIDQKFDCPLGKLRRGQATQMITYLMKRVPKLEQGKVNEDERPTKPLDGRAGV